jgi:hypothetical protein
VPAAAVGGPSAATTQVIDIPVIVPTGQGRPEPGWMGHLRSALPTTVLPTVGAASRPATGGAADEPAAPAEERPGRRQLAGLLAVAGVVIVLVVVVTTTMLLRGDPPRTVASSPTGGGAAGGVVASSSEPAAASILPTGQAARPSASPSRSSPSPTRRSPSARASSTSSAPAAACTAGAGIQSTWHNGGTLAVSMTNTGTKPIKGWTLTFTVATGMRVTSQTWNGTWSQAGNTVTVRNAAFNDTLAVGQTLGNVGANFWGPAQKPATVASGFAVNGVACR